MKGQGLWLDTMALDAICISDSNLEKKTKDVQHCFDEKNISSGKIDKAKGTNCPSFDELTIILNKKAGFSDCFFGGLGWIDENGERVNATIAEDIASLNPEISAQLTDEVFEECVMEAVEELEDSAECAYTEEESAVLEEMVNKIASFQCFHQIFDKACKSFVLTKFVHSKLHAQSPEIKLELLN